MKKYIYNKDTFEFYTSDGSTVQAWQVENGNTWTLEIFPPNQTIESFEACQYSGGVTMSTVDMENTWYIREYPTEWTNKLYKEFCELLAEQLSDMKLVIVREYCDHCGIEVDTYDEPVYELEDGRIYCEECYIEHLVKQKV